MKGGAWHQEIPGHLHKDLQFVVSANLGVVHAALDIDVREPAFAACLLASDDPELSVAHISLGLESDRQGLIDECTPWEAGIEVWNPANYSFDALEVANPRGDDFLHAESRINQWLVAAEVEEPSRWVLEEIAAHLTRYPPDIPRTDDFVAYAFAQGDDLTASLRWIAPIETQRLLETKRLLVDDFDSLPGAPDYG